MRNDLHVPSGLGVPARFPCWRVVFLMLAGWVAIGVSATGADNIDLVSQLDPFTGNDRYGDIWGEGSFAYIGSFQGSGVGIISIADLSNPTLSATYNPNPGQGQFKDIKVANGVGYFASDNGGGVHVVDLSDPTNPFQLSQITPALGGHGSIHNLSVHDGYLYEADSRSATIKVFDVSDPSNPQFVRNIVAASGGRIHDVTALHGRLYAADITAARTLIYDVSNVGSQAPPLLANFGSGPSTHSLWPTDDGNLLAVAQERDNGEVRLYDISTLSSPVVRSSVTRGSLGISAFSPHNPLIRGELLFVSWYQAGVQVLNIRDPANPVLVGSYDTFPGAVSGFDGNWGVYPFLGLGRVLASDLDGGLFVLDASAVIPEPDALTLWVLGGAVVIIEVYRRRAFVPCRKSAR